MDGYRKRSAWPATAALIFLWTVALLAIVCGEAAWFARPDVVRGDTTSIERHIVRQLQQAVDNRNLGCAALVVIQRGAIVAEQTFGVANAATNAPVDPDRTLFLLASVSKAVTAWGVMKLVEDGRLHLDEPVMRRLQRWRFPGSETYRDRVTVRHLLSHTAGLDDGLGYGGFEPGESVQTLEESLNLTKDSTVGAPRAVTVTREPGSGMSYSGGGYTILQLLIEEVTQQPFAVYMRSAVLQPLGMIHSSFDLDAIAAEGRAQDLATSYDAALALHPPRRYTAQAAVSLRATARDVARFALALMHDNPVLRPETVKGMLTPQPGTSGTWGLGHTLFAENSAGGYVAGHGGGTYPAWGATVRVNPATGNGLVLMVSGGGGRLNRASHDWLYWETGTIGLEARRDLVFSRVKPLSIGILSGAVAIVLYRRRVRKSA